jgi:hypothetical protein
MADQKYAVIFKNLPARSARTSATTPCVALSPLCLPSPKPMAKRLKPTPPKVRPLNSAGFGGRQNAIHAINN